MVGKVSINVDITAIYKLAAGTTFKLEMLLNQRFQLFYIKNFVDKMWANFSIKFVNSVNKRENYENIRST